MRKLNKLIMTILPISSLSVFSVVSCTTDTKNKPDKIPQLPNSKKPNSNSDKKINETGTNENSPTKPEATDDPNSNNNQSNNNSNGQHSQNDKPQADELPKNNVDFSDIDSLQSEISLNRFTNYMKMDPITAWTHLIADLNVFKNIIFKDYPLIINKYTMEFESPNDVQFENSKGIITNVKIKFTKDNLSKIKIFSFSGFKIKDKIVNKNNKQDYIKQKKVDEKIAGLYPSLLAYMLLYNEETGSNNKYDKDIKRNGNVVNFDDLRNTNKDLFDDNFVGFNVGTKELLLEYNKKYEQLYKDKIIEAKFDDINGTLGLKIQIENREDNLSNESIITKEFNFTGFRKIDFANKENPFDITLLQKDLKTILANTKIKNSLKKIGFDIDKDDDLEEFGVPSENNLWESEIYKYLIFTLTDTKNHIYNAKQTLKIDPNSNKYEYKSILGLKSNMSLYPFSTMITKESIKNMLITVKNKKVTLEFELHIPVYATSFSDLITHTTNGKDLVIRIVQSTSI
ncbi:LppA family lipoprotein [Mycoplasma capricolum]|uniref:LppA family lipoprotein n=1 Tax=Mycoplasma capricolum TaxID=2095 RepID=UPI003DA34E57